MTWNDDFHVEIHEEGRGPVLEVAGDLDVFSAPQLRDAVESAARSHPARMVIDLSEVTFIDVAGMTSLLDSTAQAREARCVCLVRHPSRPVRRYMELVDVTGRLILEDDAEPTAG